MLDPVSPLNYETKLLKDLAERFPVRVGDIDIRGEINLSRIICKGATADQYRSRFSTPPQLSCNARQHEQLPLQGRGRDCNAFKE